MQDLNKQIGKKLRMLRKTRQITLSDLAGHLNKSVSTISKYEKGEIAVDLGLLLELCRFYNVSLSSLLPEGDIPEKAVDYSRYRDFFVDRFYVYALRKSDNVIHKCVVENDNETMTSNLYWGIASEEDYMDCKFLYVGNVYYSDYSTNYVFFNQMLPFDMITLNVPANNDGREDFYAIMTAVTIYYQCMASRALVSLEPVPDSVLMEKLPLSSDDIKELKRTNYLTV